MENCIENCSSQAQTHLFTAIFKVGNDVFKMRSDLKNFICIEHKISAFSEQIQKFALLEATQKEKYEYFHRWPEKVQILLHLVVLFRIISIVIDYTHEVAYFRRCSTVAIERLVPVHHQHGTEM